MTTEAKTNPDPRAEYIAGPTDLATYTAGGRSGWEQRFWKRVSKSPDGCWRWTGAWSGSGYGQITIGHKRRSAHRLSWLLHHGSIPAALHLDHLCRNTRCVNPAHLEPVTCRENTMRGINQVAQFARAATCTEGHPFDEQNTYAHRGHRLCKQCRRAASREYQRRRRQALRSAS